MIKIIACLDANGGIGKDNRLLTHLPKDLKHFKETTKGHICVFGRKTFESLPRRPLEGRKTVILTNNKNYTQTGCKVVHEIKDILDISKQLDVYICGGAEVYKQFMPYADELIISQIEEEFDADTFFPEIDEKTWFPYSCEGIEDKINFDIIKYKRKHIDNGGLK
jgi:dihydrofolate reductase